MRKARRKIDDRYDVSADRIASDPDHTQLSLYLQEVDEYVAKGMTDCFVEYKDDVSPVVRMAWYDVVPPKAQPPASESSSECADTPEPSHLVLRAATAASA